MKNKTILVLHPINGFLIGALVTPDSSFYEVMSIWAEQQSSITDEYGKAVVICRFVKDSEDNSVSIHWTQAVKRVNTMTSLEEMLKFTEGEQRKPVLEAINERKKEFDGGKTTDKDPD